VKFLKTPWKNFSAFPALWKKFKGTLNLVSPEQLIVDGTQHSFPGRLQKVAIVGRGTHCRSRGCPIVSETANFM
jgi:hypothetical protein